MSTLLHEQTVPELADEQPRFKTVITPTTGLAPLNLGELWAYRELLFFLALRDVKVRYKQAALGVTWAVMQPVLQMVIFTVIFGMLAKLPSEGEAPYALMTSAALLPWNLFAQSLTRAGTSLVTNANLITKVYFPRLVVPLAAVGACLVDFLVSFLVLVGLVVYFDLATPWHFVAGWPLLLLPAFALLAVLTSLAVSLWLSAMNVQYRDVQHTIPFLVQVWMYASPVAYSAGLVPQGPWQMIYALNPMAGVIQGFRWALLGGPPPTAMLAVSVVVVVLLLVGGLYYFKHMEKTFADVV